MAKTSNVSGKLIGRFIGCCQVPMWEIMPHKDTLDTSIDRIKTTMKLMESPDATGTTRDFLDLYFVACETEHPFTERLSNVSCLENIDVPDAIWEEIIVRRVLKQL